MKQRSPKSVQVELHRSLELRSRRRSIAHWPIDGATGKIIGSLIDGSPGVPQVLGRHWYCGPTNMDVHIVMDNDSTHKAPLHSMLACQAGRVTICNLRRRVPPGSILSNDGSQN